MSMNPGIAVVSVAETSLAPAGKRRLLRGPTASITSSRIRIPASLISEAGVKARPAWIRVVGMVVEHRNGNVGRDKTKRADQPWVCPLFKNKDACLALLAGHFDAGQLKRLAVHRALDGNVVAGMLRYLVVQSPAFSFAPFAPHWLSEIQPVQEPSAAIARVPANSVAAIAVESLSFMVSPLQKSILW